MPAGTPTSGGSEPQPWFLIASPPHDGLEDEHQAASIKFVIDQECTQEPEEYFD